MNRWWIYFSIAIFSIFLGSQITEGWLFLPYWKTLSGSEFYGFYAEFGQEIGRFYTVLTVAAVCIPIGASMYSFYKKSRALNYSIVSTFFALLIIALFYVYLKDINQQFYEAALSSTQLEAALKTWGHLHWIRVLFEVLSLIFLIQTYNILSQERNSISLHSDNLNSILK